MWGRSGGRTGVDPAGVRVNAGPETEGVGVNTGVETEGVGVNPVGAAVDPVEAVVDAGRDVEAEAEAGSGRAKNG